MDFTVYARLSLAKTHPYTVRNLNISVHVAAQVPQVLSPSTILAKDSKLQQRQLLMVLAQYVIPQFCNNYCTVRVSL